MTSEKPAHGLVFVPCTEIGHITTTRYESTTYGPIASIDLGGGVSVHVHTAEAARQGLKAWIDALRILDPDGPLAEIDDADDLADMAALNDDGAEVEVVMYGGVPLDVAQPEDIPVGLYPSYLALGPEIVAAKPVPECSECGITDPVRVGEHGRCWNSANCERRAAEKASAL